MKKFINLKGVGGYYYAPAVMSSGIISDSYIFDMLPEDINSHKRNDSQMFMADYALMLITKYMDNNCNVSFCGDFPMYDYIVGGELDCDDSWYDTLSRIIGNKIYYIIL